MEWLSDKAIERLREAAEIPNLAGTNYTLLGRIARGGMGVVWLAEDAKLARRVALKVLDLEDAAGQLEERLLQEARILARLEHPGIVPVHDVGRLADGRVFYTMKFVEGARLDRHVAQLPALPDRLRIFQRICEAVSFAHARGVLHRDLKPENIMVGPFGEVLVMDWGVAKLRPKMERSSQNAESGDQAPANESLNASRVTSGEGPAGASGSPTRSGEDGQRATSHGAVLGTPGYMAPEQARGEIDALDERADVYSLGAILRFLVSGRSPEDATTQSLNAHARRGPHPAAAHGTERPLPGDVPKALRAIVAKALFHEPGGRYAGAAELAADVARFLDGLPVAAYPEGPLQKVHRLYLRHRVAVWLIVTYMVVRGLILVFLGR